METKVSFISNLKTIPRKNFHQWQFWYKLSATLIIFGVLISSLIIDLVSLSVLHTKVDQWVALHGAIPKDAAFWEEFKETFGAAKGFDWVSLGNGDPLQSQVNYGGFLIAHFTYFTNISNFAIAFWFLLATLSPRKEGNRGYVGYRVSVVLATYITITMIIWLCLLMPTDLANGKVMTGVDWFYGLAEHAVFPILFIAYITMVFKVDGPLLDQSSYMKKEWMKIILVLLAYGAYCLIRGEIRYQGNQPIGTQYPYFFFQIHQANVNGLPGAVWFIIAVIAIALICMGFSSGYNKILLIRQQKNINAMIR